MPKFISIVIEQGAQGGGQKLLSIRKDLGLDLTSALQLCVVDTEVILPVSPTDNMGCQHLKMLSDAGFQLSSPKGLSNAYRDLPAQDHMALVRVAPLLD